MNGFRNGGQLHENFQMNAECYRPTSYENAPGGSLQEHGTDQLEEEFRAMVKAGMAPNEVADRVSEAIVQDRFYIFTHPEMHAIVKSRMEDIIQGRNPTAPTPPSPDRVNH